MGLKSLFIRREVNKYLKSIEPSVTKFLDQGGKMKGWRTLAFNAGILAATAALTYIAGVDLGDYGVTGTTGVVVLAVVNFFLRLVTNTPVGRKENLK